MKNFLVLSALLLFAACKKDEPKTVYDLSKITGSYEGLLHIHKITKTNTGPQVSTNDSFVTRVTVSDLHVDGRYFSVSSNNFVWIDSIHRYYPFDTAYKQLPSGISFNRDGNTIYIIEASQAGFFPYYETYFVGHK